MKIRPQLLGIETITGLSRGKRSYIKTANCFFAEWSLHFLAEFSFFSSYVKSTSLQNVLKLIFKNKSANYLVSFQRSTSAGALHFLTYILYMLRTKKQKAQHVFNGVDNLKLKNQQLNQINKHNNVFLGLQRRQNTSRIFLATFKVYNAVCISKDRSVHTVFIMLHAGRLC